MTCRNHVSSIHRMGIQGPLESSPNPLQELVKDKQGDFMDPIKPRHWGCRSKETYCEGLRYSQVCKYWFHSGQKCANQGCDRRLITWKYEDGEEWGGANRFRRGSHESDTQKIETQVN